jgi:hypothetical protein
MSLKLEKMCATKIFPDANKMITPSPSKANDGRIRAAFYSQKVWKKNSEITISFVGDPTRISLSTSTDETEDPLQSQLENMNYKDAIKKIIMERLQPLVNLKFIFLDDNVNTALVRIDFDPNKGSWSLLGTDCMQNKDGPTMNFAWFDVGTVLHEFGHLLGMIHEHQNPRGEKIKWDANKVYKWAESTQGWDKKETDTNILNAYDIDHINGSDFDPLSIMLYFFPASLTTNGKGTKQNLRFSGIDVTWINKIYLRPDGPSPDIYYKSAYNVPLQTSIDKSRQLAKRGTGVNSTFLKLLLFSVICILLYLFVTKFLLKKRKKK